MSFFFFLVSHELTQQLPRNSLCGQRLLNAPLYTSEAAPWSGSLWCPNTLGAVRKTDQNIWASLKTFGIEIPCCQRINIWMSFACEWRSTWGDNHGFLHVSYEATETLQDIPVRATLISAVAYLAAGADRRLGGGVGGLFALSSVQ